MHFWISKTQLWGAALGEGGGNKVRRQGAETYRTLLFKNRLIIVQELNGTLTTSAKIRRFSDEEGTKVADKGLCSNAGLRQGSVVTTTGGGWLCLA